MKKALAFLMAAVMLMSMLTACGNKDNAADNNDADNNNVNTEETDKAAADKVAALIDAIYVQERTEETSCEAVIEAVKNAGYTTVVLRPLMVVAGDHANNDMAGADDDSWKTMFEAAGFTVNCQISGLGRIADVQALYVAHTKAAIDAIA